MYKNIDKPDYKCWLQYRKIKDVELLEKIKKWSNKVIILGNRDSVMESAVEEIKTGLDSLIGVQPVVENITRTKVNFPQSSIILGSIKTSHFISENISKERKNNLKKEGYIIKNLKKDDKDYIIITGNNSTGILYGVFEFLKFLTTGKELENINFLDNPASPLRIINHWDNLDGSIERGYAGNSIFYNENKLKTDKARIMDYARLLASIGINSIVVNNVNVSDEATRLIGEKIDMVKELSKIFANYGIKLFLSINYASSIQLGNLNTADPLNSEVRKWWQQKVAEVYEEIPDFGGFLVKADSEGRPGPFTYDRSHAEGANMLAEALDPFGGILIWRCFVYNCQQDWRDRSTDRAKAAYDNFKPLDGDFNENVILQIKNGPMDFQVREPVSPLLGAMEETNQILELQITQEYTGQQVHLCYLIPQWKEVLEFDTYVRGEGSEIRRVVDGSLYNQLNCGMAGVVNVGDDINWTGHTLAQANLYGFGRLAWNPELSSEKITEDWIKMTFGQDLDILNIVKEMLLSSWEIYENYTSPLGIGWMVNPGHHYGPSVDGYEYSRWGTYHRADCFGIGVDRTMSSGTGYTGQYFKENAQKYETPDSCPDELILFFHHLPYSYVLESGETIIQYIYNTHFKGVKQVEKLLEKWNSLENNINQETYESVSSRLEQQLKHAKEWRDVINSYFFRKTGIPDEKGRRIY
ncbi:MAG: alpha-glucuronidase family glycosyl hydrolase [Halanaerobiales bacterium]